MDKIQLTARIYDFNRNYDEPDGEDSKGQYIDRDIAQLDLENRFDGKPIAWCTQGFSYHSFDLKINGLTPARTKELAEAELEGRLVVLPADADICQYAVVPMNCEYGDCPIEDEEGNCPAITNPNLSIPDCCPRIIVQVVPGRQRFEDLVGLQIYATHEEAEAALKETT